MVSVIVVEEEIDFVALGGCVCKDWLTEQGVLKGGVGFEIPKGRTLEASKVGLKV